MKYKVNVPIRFKILTTVLFIITVVVGIITFTMANMFHSDKATYVNDLTSVMAMNKSQETKALLIGYRERLQVFTRLLYEKGLYQDQKSKLLKQLFEDFQEFIAISLYQEGGKPVTVFDTKSLESAGLTIGDLTRYRKDNPFPVEKIHHDKVFVENSTLTGDLPTMTLAISHQPSDSQAPVIVSAAIRLENLMRLAERSTVFESFIVDSRGYLLAHSDAARIYPKVRVDWIPGIEKLRDQKSLGTTIEYNHEGKLVVGGFSPIDFGTTLAGVEIRKTAAYLTARELLNSLLYISLALLIISAVLSIFWSKRLTRPIEQLSDAAKVVGKGDFAIQVKNNSGDEIGKLANSFNTMASELDSREKALRDTQTALIHSEKMAAFGQLGAGIAHEVKNPLAGILGFAQLSLRKTDKESPLHKNLITIEKETKRCKNIIENLMKFARQEKVDFMPINVNNVVEDAMAIVDHQLSMHQVKLEMKLAEDIPLITGNGNQLQQVLMNLMINAQQALDGNPGLVSMETRLDGNEHVEIRIRDSGPGIPEEMLSKIFDPFFTTKAAGQGTGLGLSVSYGIIKDHSGNIRVESKPDEGTLFIISLPLHDVKDTGMQAENRE